MWPVQQGAHSKQAMDGCVPGAIATAAVKRANVLLDHAPHWVAGAGAFLVGKRLLGDVYRGERERFREWQNKRQMDRLMAQHNGH
jgi:hypothetical protein